MLKVGHYWFQFVDPFLRRRAEIKLKLKFQIHVIPEIWILRQASHFPECIKYNDNTYTAQSVEIRE